MQEQENPQNDMWATYEKAHRRGKVMGGLLILTIGSLFLARELGAQLPEWLFSWKTLLIGLGVVIAVKHKFRNASWIFLIGIGSAFLINDFYPEMHFKPFLLPLFLIAIGLFVMFKPRRKHQEHFRKWKHYHRHRDYSREYYERKYQQAEGQGGDQHKDDYLEFHTVMAGVKKNVLSKKFKGGEVVTILGGTEINLSQSDFEGRASLDITQVLGGTKLVVPANWIIQSELVTIMGSVEDKRPFMQQGTNNEPEKLLVLTGNTIMGGVEIVSY